MLYSAWSGRYKGSGRLYPAETSPVTPHGEPWWLLLSIVNPNTRQDLVGAAQTIVSNLTAPEVRNSCSCIHHTAFVLHLWIPAFSEVDVEICLELHQSQQGTDKITFRAPGAPGKLRYKVQVLSAVFAGVSAEHTGEFEILPMGTGGDSSEDEGDDSDSEVQAGKPSGKYRC